MRLAPSCPAERRPVMLSVAKHLSAERERPFAALRVTYGEATRVTPGGLSTVGFLGQIVTSVGAGEGRSGVGTLASPMGAGGKRLPCSFHKIPTYP
ncbi:MAG: hypothetical protein E6I80_26385 [Chloroflexi bacterium]|nr:MAG: hypothetical protein E6I80_26385 [Chloroflexota bacterium]